MSWGGLARTIGRTKDPTPGGRALNGKGIPYRLDDGSYKTVREYVEDDRNIHKLTDKGIRHRLVDNQITDPVELFKPPRRRGNNRK